mgnify:CR=1 FL=1
MEGTAEGYSYASHSIDERNAMARYDYRCTECGTVFEVEHPMGERPEVACPACGAELPEDRVKCPHCGEMNIAGATVCSECGSDIAGAEGNVAAPAAPGAPAPAVPGAPKAPGAPAAPAAPPKAE